MTNGLRNQKSTLCPIPKVTLRSKVTQRSGTEHVTKNLRLVHHDSGGGGGGVVRGIKEFLDDWGW